MVRTGWVLIITAILSLTAASCPDRLSWSGQTVERRTRRSPLVFHGLAVEDYPAADPSKPPAQGYPYTAQFWLISVYKGAKRLAKIWGVQRPTHGVYDIRDRRVNVTGFYRPNGTNTPKCWNPVTSQKYYVVFAEIAPDQTLRAKDDSTVGSIADWTEHNEARVWRAMGWDEWSDWSVCSASCDGGVQQRWRYCLQHTPCQGYNKQSRLCNTFTCTGAVAPLSLEGKRQWERVPGRESAWRLRANSYFWLPAAQLPFPANYFRNHFALILSLRLDPKKVGGGTLVSLKSRRREECYFAVELAGSEAIKMVHSGPNGTQSVLIPAQLNDGKWHHLALGIQDDSSVRSYFDCRWVSTDILKRNSLDIPDDADLVIGYLFSGELEQMVIVGDPGGVAQQCSTNVTPVLDPLLEAARPHKHKTPPMEELKWSEKKVMTATKESPLELLTDDEDMQFEGSGNGQAQSNSGLREWSECSVTCGLGIQESRCLDETSPCPRTTRACNAGSCPVACPGCGNGGRCVGPGVCECPHNATGTLCQTPVCDPPCLNGATCAQGNSCLCHPYTSGNRCEKKKCEYRPVQEPYTRGFRKLAKKRVQNKCDPFSWKTCISTVPEFKTVYKTFYKTVYKCLDQP